MEEQKCDGCGKTFAQPASQVARNTHNFCGRPCYLEWKKTPENNPWFGVKGENSPGWNGGPVTVTCAYCGKEVEREKGRAEAREEHFCSKRCQYLHRVGQNSQNWKGGRKRVGGYIRVWRPGHPNADCVGYVGESRLVMEAAIDRLLTKDEVVHHIDFNPLNNMPSNLMLFESNAAHVQHHWDMRQEENGEEREC